MSSFKHYILILAISALPFVTVFLNPNLPHTSDGGVHLPRIAAYVKALQDGHFPVRWAGDLNYGYGLPLFNFMYPAPYFIGALFVLSGLGLVVSFKLVLLLSFLLSGIFMYIFALELFEDERVAMLLTVFYQFAPFRLVELLVRGSIGSVYAYAFLPLVLYGVTHMHKKPVVSSGILLSIATGLLVISHNSLSLVFFLVACVYAASLTKFKKPFISVCIALFLGLALAAFYWVPALAEHSYTYGDLFMRNLYKGYFPPLINFFIPNFTDIARLRVGEVSVQLGLFHTIALILTCIVLVRGLVNHQLTKLLLILSVILTSVTLFIMQPVSLFLWERISLLRQFQFPWRFLGITTLTTSIMALSFISFGILKNKFLYVALLVLTVASTAYYWYPPQGFDKVREADFWNYPLNTTYFGETDLIWSGGPAKGFPKNRIEVIEGIATVSNFTKKTQIHSFNVTAERSAKLVDNTQYYPGWRVYVDSQKVPIQFQDANYRGLITFDVPAGTHAVRAVFEESPIRLGSDLLTAVTAPLLLGLILWYGKKRLI